MTKEQKQFIEHLKKHYANLYFYAQIAKDFTIFENMEGFQNDYKE